MGIATITSVIVWKIYNGSKKDLMFFFNTSVACIINRTSRKHSTSEVKESVIFLQTNICGYTTLHQGYAGINFIQNHPSLPRDRTQREQKPSLRDNHCVQNPSPRDKTGSQKPHPRNIKSENFINISIISDTI